MLLKDSYQPEDLDFAGKLGVSIYYGYDGIITVRRTYSQDSVKVREMLRVKADAMRPLSEVVRYIGLTDEKRAKMTAIMDASNDTNSFMGYCAPKESNSTLEVVVMVPTIEGEAMQKQAIENALAVFDELERVISSG
jgi:hypothetical protein